MFLRNLFLATTVLAAGIGAAAAQSGPTGAAASARPLRIIAAEQGGSGDVIARLVAPGLAEGLNQPVVVENLATATAAAIAAARSSADGYTLSTSGNSIWLLPFIEKDPPVSPLKDFSMVVMTSSSPAVLAVHPSFAVGSVKDLIAQARAKPGGLRAATATPGSITQLSLELFRSMARIDFAQTAYKGAVPAMTGLVAGEAQFMFFPVNLGAAQIKAGKLKPLAVASAQPTALLPGVPTISATGLPGYESGAFQVVFAPAGTPEPIIARQNQAIVRHINKPDVKAKLFGMGLDVVGASPKDSLEMVKAEMDRMGKVIRDAGLKGQ